MKSRNVKIALIQLEAAPSSTYNLNKTLEKIAEAADKGAKIVALQELFTGTYFCQRPDDKKAFDKTELIPGPTSKALAAAAKKYKLVIVGGSIFEKTKKGYFNTSMVFGPNGKLLGTYRKTHIPEDILYHEQHYFKSSKEGVKIFDTPYGKIAVLICYDQWFPEFARIATLKGAEIIFYPTAIGVIDESVEDNITGNWQEMWTNVMLGHAAANNVAICAINRVGKEGAITFWGGSFIADPSSKILAKGGKKEQIITAEVDLSRVKALQKAWRFLECRNPDMYKDLTK